MLAANGSTASNPAAQSNGALQQRAPRGKNRLWGKQLPARMIEYMQSTCQTGQYNRAVEHGLKNGVV